MSLFNIMLVSSLVSRRVAHPLRGHSLAGDAYGVDMAWHLEMGKAPIFAPPP